jgi:AraC-like DNA-binding protein
LRGALELACRFAPTVTTAIALRLEVEEMTASLVVEEIGSLGAARETMIISLMLGLWRIGCFITGVELEGRAEFAFLKPLYFSRFAALAPGNVAFSMPVHRLSFDARLLERPLLLSDPSALRLARAQCERELDALHQHGDLVARMQSLVFRQDGGQPKLGELAHQSHTSVRTLERKLRDQGTSYSKLRDQARRSTALDLLSTELSVEEIAARLGYSDAANFTRAFRRWTGQSPRAHRAARRNAESGSQPGDRGAK